MNNESLYKTYNVSPEAKAKALSPLDIAGIVRKPFKTLKYSEFAGMRKIDDAFVDCDDVLIIYETRKNYGHWVALHKSKRNTISYFDPYGFDNFDTDELSYTKNKQFKKENNMDYPYLLKLLYESNKPIEYNDFQFQKKATGINTCGRWCAFFFITNDFMKPDDLVTMMKDIPLNERDDYITILTETL